MRIYISGKISGLPIEEARIPFDNAISDIEGWGYIPVSPFGDGWLGADVGWKKHMVRDIEVLLTCDAIYMLSNWDGSKGARIERFIAQQLGMEIMYESSVHKTVFGRLDKIGGNGFYPPILEQKTGEL